VAVGPSGCESEPDWAKCNTYIDCPEVPDVSCDVAPVDSPAGITIDFTWDEPTVGTISHADWSIEMLTTVQGPKLCDHPSGREIACASYIPTFGLEACDETLEEACGDMPTEGDSPSKARLSEICQLECAMYESLSSLIEGTVVN
jgi:hypothetical protein